MDGTERERGRIMSRRELLGFFGAWGAAAFVPGRTQGAGPEGLPGCIVRPEQTEGPYFVDEGLRRSDIRADPASGEMKPGAPLRLAFKVSQLGGNACRPLAGARVDVWHCDALGVYSDVRDAGFQTIGRKFLRGYQLTDETGKAEFLTIYPGWYQGRAVHIHFKIRTAPGAARGTEFTSQLYFDDALTDKVHAAEPYVRKGARRLRNGQDGIYARSGGRQLMLELARAGEGYAGQFAIGLAPA